MENPIKMDDLGVPLFSETSIWYISYIPLFTRAYPIIDLLVPSFQGLAEVLVVMHQSLGKKKVSNQKPRFSEFVHTWDWYIYLPGKVHLWKLSLIQEKCMVYVWYIYLHENQTLRIHTPSRFK